MSSAFRRAALVLAGVLLSGLSAQAAPPAAAPARGWLDPLRYRDALTQAAAAVQHVEAVEMVTAVVNGSQMGPGEGWFHAGQSRYSWQWLAARYDANHDGVITREEFTGPPAVFERLDRDGNGVITADDFDWSEKSPFVQQADMAEHVFRMIDRNSNGKLSRAEWDSFFEKMAKERDFVTQEDLRTALFPPRPRPAPGQSAGGPTPDIFLKGLLTGELGSLFPGPSVGQVAPDFTLKTEDGQAEMSLSEFHGKPVVLVFGSFT
jgi:hypothetical protein